MKTRWLSSCLAFMTLLFVSSNSQASELKVGDVAPTFELVDQHGKTISLASYSGQWVVLYFYPKNDTPGCTTEACSFRDHINQLITQQAIVLGVSVDSEASHKAFAEKYKLPFSLLADQKAQVTSRYGSLLDLKVIKYAKRHSFIIDPQGNIAKIYRQVDPDTHVQEVLSDLKQLQGLRS